MRWLGLTALLLVALPAGAAAAEPRTTAIDLDYVAAPRIGADLPGADLRGPRAAGDVNGDGRPDTIAALAPPAYARAKRLRVIFTPPLGGTLRLSRQTGFDIRVPGDPTSAEYAPAGDVNGDGFADLVVATPRRAYVVEGAASTSTVRLASLGARGFTIDGLDPGGSEYGAAAFGAGDLNGDGLADVVVGSPGSDPGGRAQAGSAFVVYGESASGPVDVNALGARGYRIDGAAAGDRLGSFGAPAGDVNGDGRPDLALGGDRSQPEFADDPLWVVTAGGDLDLAHPGTAAYPLTGAVLASRRSLSGTGDVNGDGRGDLAVADAGTTQAFLVYGSPTQEPVDLDKPDPQRVVTMSHAGSRTDGVSVTSAGDATGDGLADVLVGGGPRGTSVVRGARDLPPELDLRTLGTRGFRLAYASADGLGDVDGDGVPELLASIHNGYRCRPTSDTGSGSIVLLRGGAALPPPLLPHGRYTKGDDRLRGTPRDDVIFGARGNDRIVGRGGDDCLRGGDDDFFDATDDELAPRPDKDTIYGGPGRDFIEGGTAADRIYGGRGNDIIDAGFGRDRVFAGPGDDFVVEEYPEYKPGSADTVKTGAGDDEIYSSDGNSDTIDCGPGRDRIIADRDDELRGCERVRRTRDVDAGLDYPIIYR
jgi:Ca2+-binding RTX toxin-like protein